MSRPDLDPHLERSFAALREQERQAGPPFRPLWAAAGTQYPSAGDSPSRLFRLAAAGAAVVAVALLSAWLVALRVPAAPAFLGAAPSISTWRSPTDFLLRTPGQEILREAPALGRGFALEEFPSIPSPTTDRRPS